MAHEGLSARQGDVDLFRFDFFLQSLLFEFGHALLQGVFNEGTGRVDHLVDLRAFFFGQFAQFFHEGCEFTFFAQVFDPDILDILQGFALVELFADSRFDGVNFFLHHLVFPPLVKKIDSRPERGESLISRYHPNLYSLFCNGNSRPAYSVQQEAPK